MIHRIRALLEHSGIADDMAISFGTSLDMTVGWDATNSVLEFLPLTDDTGAWNFGDGTTDADVKMFLGATTKYVEFNKGDAKLNLEDVDMRLGDNDIVEFGDSADVTLHYNSTRQALVTTVLGDYVAPEGMSDRYRLVWVAGARGKPGANADILSATESTNQVTDPDFEVKGTNASSDDVTFYAEGGITLTTDGTDGDGVIILPHLDANESAWTQVTWGSDKEVRWECDITTGAAITNEIIWAGLKLTETDVVITDADQAFFRYENAINSGKWQAVSSINDADDAHDSGVTVVAATRYHLAIEISAARLAKFYINGVLVETSAALKDATDFIPYIAVECDGTGAGKVLNIHGQAISRTIG